MKKPILIITFFILFISYVIDVEAQYRRRRGRFSVKDLFHSVDFNLGYYTPSMSYWNEESFISDAGKSFEGGLMFQGGLELEPIPTAPGFLVGLYGGTYSDNVKAYSDIGGIERDEKLTYRVTPLSLQLKYQFQLGDQRSRYRNTGMARLHPYLGGGLNYALISQTTKREFTDPNRETQKTTQSGSTVTYSGLVGLKYDLSSYFGLGAELNYYIGGFDQLIESTASGDQRVEEISLTGPCISGKLYIKFPKRRGRRGPRRR